MATFGPQPQVEISIDKVPVIHMTPDRVARLHAQADEARALQLPQLHNAECKANRARYSAETSFKSSLNISERMALLSSILFC